MTTLTLTAEQQARHDELVPVCAATGLRVVGPTEWDRRSHGAVYRCYDVAAMHTDGVMVGYFNDTNLAADFVFDGRGSALEVLAFYWLEIGRYDGRDEAASPLRKWTRESRLPNLPKALASQTTSRELPLTAAE